MKCENCGAPATIHTLVIVGSKKQELHFCTACAQEKKMLNEDQQAILPNIVQQVFHAESSTGECPDCGTKYMEFRKQGRLGCPNDYVVFRNGLLPLLDRVHRATHHTGKRPRGMRGALEDWAPLRKLRHQLRLAVRAENYGEAQRLRDLIREKEGEYGPR